MILPQHRNNPNEDFILFGIAIAAIVVFALLVCGGCNKPKEPTMAIFQGTNEQPEVHHSAPWQDSGGGWRPPN